MRHTVILFPSLEMKWSWSVECRSKCPLSLIVQNNRNLSHVFCLPMQTLLQCDSVLYGCVAAFPCIRVNALDALPKEENVFPQRLSCLRCHGCCWLCKNRCVTWVCLICVPLAERAVDLCCNHKQIHKDHKTI